MRSIARVFRAVFGGWFGFLVLLFGALVARHVGADAGVGAPRPEPMALLLAWIALDGKRDAVIPAAAIVGAATALYSLDPAWARIGIATAAAVAVLVLRGFLFRRHPTTPFLVSVVVVFLTRLGDWWVAHPEAVGSSGSVLGAAAFGAVVTGLGACFAFPLLRRIGWCGRMTRRGDGR